MKVVADTSILSVANVDQKIMFLVIYISYGDIGRGSPLVRA